REYGASDVASVAVLHGGPRAPGSVASLARLLSDRFHVLEPSPRRSGTVALTVTQHVGDLAHVLPGWLPIVGWSWGAMLALSFAVDHPDLVQALALVGCGTYDPAARGTFTSAKRSNRGPGSRRSQAGGRRAGRAEQGGRSGEA